MEIGQYNNQKFVRAFVKKYRVVQFFLILALSVAHNAMAQFSTGTWRDHLPYGNVIDVCYDEINMVYAATPYAIVSYNPATFEVERWSKVNRLSDVGISAVEYDAHSDAVIVGYSNGNLDILLEDGQFNMPDIKLSNIVGDKQIYDILSYNGLLYLSTGFGVVVIDLTAREVRSTYFLGPNGEQQKVNDVLVLNNEIYAISESRVLKASVTNPFLANFQNWTVVTDWPAAGAYADATEFAGNLFVHTVDATNDKIHKKDLTTGTWSVFSEFGTMRFGRIWNSEDYLCLTGEWAAICYDELLYLAYNISDLDGGTIAPNFVIRDMQNTLWVADKGRGLVGRKGNGQDLTVRPDGPASAEVRKLNAYNNNLWVAHGAIYPYGGNLWRPGNFSGRVGDTWTTYLPGAGANSTPGVSDMADVAIDPYNNNRVFYGSWEEGLIQRATDGTLTYYNVETGNNPLQGSGFTWAPGWTGVGGVAFDPNGVLWLTNSYSSKPVQAVDREGNFIAFSCAPYVTNDDWLKDIMPTREGYIWAIVAGRGIVVRDPNGTVSNASDDDITFLSEAEGAGGLANKDVFCMIEDLDGEIWVGTLQGLSVFYSQSSLFSEDPLDGEPILITQDGNVQKLLDTETITCIEIDGGNRKWIGTRNSGVYLFSSDGLQQIEHFTQENSPLPTNSISDIAINQDNGEVFIASEEGMVSYFSTATNFDQEMKNVRVFPNPVSPEFDGNITVDGLAYNSSVRITDAAGNVVFQGESEGGRVFWNGKTTDGQRPATGMYYVYSSNPDGKKTETLQLTFIH